MTIDLAPDGAEQTTSKGFLVYSDGLEKLSDLAKPIGRRSHAVELIRYIGGGQGREVDSGLDVVVRRRRGAQPDEVVLVQHGQDEPIHRSLAAGPDDQYTVLTGPMPERATDSRPAEPVQQDRLGALIEQWVRNHVAQIPTDERRRLEDELAREPGRDIGWVVAQVLVNELTDTGRSLDQHIGPWRTTDQVGRLLQLDADTLEQLAEERHLLGIRFADGQLYFPSRQFRHEQPVHGLQVVLDTLATAVDDPETWALWLAGDFTSIDGRTSLASKWEAMNADHLDDLIIQAGRDSRSWVS